MAVRVSFSEVDKKDFAPVPAGVYPLVVASVEESEDVGPSGYSYLKWEFTVPEGEYENRKFWMNTSLSPKAAFKLLELLEAFGEDEETLKSEDFEFEPSDYVGAECMATIKLKPYNGELKNEIKSVSPMNAAPPPTAKKSTFGGTAQGAKKGAKIR